jgi:hypothetical protein
MFKSSSRRDFEIYSGMSDPEEFVKQFELHALFESWDDTKQALALKHFLTGKAEDVYNKAFAANKKTVAELKEALIMGCQLSREQRLQHFYDRKMKDSESIHSYAQALKSLFKKAMGEQFKAEDSKAFVQGQIINNVPPQFRAMLKIASCMGEDNFEKVIQSLTVANSELSTSLGLGGSDEAAIMNTNTYSRAIPNKNTFDGKCFNCEQYGHRIAFCSQPLRNRNRSANNNSNYQSNRSQASSNSNRRYENNANNQYKPSNNNNNANSTNENNSNNRANGRRVASSNNTEAAGVNNQSYGSDNSDSNGFGLSFDFSEHMAIEVADVNSADTSGVPLLVRLIKVCLNDGSVRVIRVLFDGGSTHSFLSPFIVDDVNNWSKAKVEKKEFVIKGAIATTQQACMVCTVELVVDEWIGQHQFVISNDVTRYDMVIGRDFFRKNKVIEDHGKDQLLIENIVVKFEADVNLVNGNAACTWDAGVHDLKRKISELEQVVLDLKASSKNSTSVKRN